MKLSVATNDAFQVQDISSFGPAANVKHCAEEKSKLFPCYELVF